MRILLRLGLLVLLGISILRPNVLGITTTGTQVVLIIVTVIALLVTLITRAAHDVYDLSEEVHDLLTETNTWMSASEIVRALHKKYREQAGNGAAVHPPQGPSLAGVFTALETLERDQCIVQRYRAISPEVYKRRGKRQPEWRIGSGGRRVRDDRATENSSIGSAAPIPT